MFAASGVEQFIAENLQSYGPLAVFILLMLSGVGLSVSEDLIVIPAGMLVGSGGLEFWPVVVASYLGVVGSDILWFTICYRWAKPLLHRRWFKRMVHPRRLLEAKHQMERRGGWVLVMARFVPGSRTTTITVAAMLHLRPIVFIGITAACVVLTVPLQLGAGMLIAHGLADKSGAELTKWIVGGIVLVIALVIVIKMLRRHRESRQRPPRAKVRWLRHRRQKKIEANETNEPSGPDNDSVASGG